MSNKNAKVRVAEVLSTHQHDWMDLQAIYRALGMEIHQNTIRVQVTAMVQEGRVEVSADRATTYMGNENHRGGPRKLYYRWVANA